MILEEEKKMKIERSVFHFNLFDIAAWHAYGKYWRTGTDAFEYIKQGILDPEHVRNKQSFAIGMKIEDCEGNEIFTHDIVQITTRSYGIFYSVADWNGQEKCFALRTFNPDAKQIKMPDGEWTKKHKPCGCDGAMFSVWRTPIREQKTENMLIVGSYLSNPELME